MATQVQALGPYLGVFTPSYSLAAWSNGDPRKRVTDVNLRSAVAIQTSKSLADLAGTFTITLKDRAARERIHEMDVMQIRFRGHGGGFFTAMRGLVDDVREGGSADPYASQEDTVITGRCLAKYLQVTSLFLPVWDPQSVLPTALTFGLGDAAKKVGGNSPREIFEYLLKHYTFGKRNIAGISGVPNSRFWISTKRRFSKSLGYEVPFLQFDEDTLMAALKRLEILGFTETWVDELGNVVYRQPKWDAPVSYDLHTRWLRDWALTRSDADVATYMEVIPAGDPGIDSALAQALRAGRAPVPSSYIDTAESSVKQSVGEPFVIQTDSSGKVTAKGARNYWYRKQRRLGLRPQQITSPLLFTQDQAQAQAEGLLEFYARLTKAGQITIPGDNVRLGRTLRLHGALDHRTINRTYYSEGIQHDYVEGEHFDTTVQLSHGRDPWDPKWGRIVLPKFDPSKLSKQGGVLDPGSGGSTGKAPKNLDEALQRMYNTALAISRKNYPYVWGGGHARQGIADRGTGRDPGIGFDCSGYQSAILGAGGLLDGTMASGGLAGWGKPGQGRYFTLYANSSHTFSFFNLPGRGKQHFGTGRFGTNKGGPGLKPDLHSTGGFAARHWPGI